MPQSMHVISAATVQVLLFTCRGSWSQVDDFILLATPGFDSSAPTLNGERIKKEVTSESAF